MSMEAAKLVADLVPGRYRLTFEMDVDVVPKYAEVCAGHVALATFGQLSPVGAALVAAERVWPFKHGEVYQGPAPDLDPDRGPAIWIARSGGHLLELLEGGYFDYSGDPCGIYDSVNPNDDPAYFSRLHLMVPKDLCDKAPG